MLATSLKSYSQTRVWPFREFGGNLLILAICMAFLGSPAFAADSTPPAWFSQMAPGTWATINLNTISDVDPEKDPALNKNFPGDAPWHGVEGVSGVLEDWNGGAFASNYGNHGALLVYGGGHKGYYGSEVYAFDLGAQRWRRLTNPYPGPFNWPYANGTFPDGSPVPIHSYDYVEYHPATNSLVILKANEDARLGDEGSRWVTHMLDLDTLQWRHSPLNSGHPSLRVGGSSCYDRNRDVFWTMAPGVDINLAKFDPSGANSDGTVGRFTNYPGDNTNIDANADCDPVRDLYVYTEFRYTGHIYARDLKNLSAPRITLKETGNIPSKSGAGGWAWSDKRQAFIYWRRGAGVFELKPQSSSATGDWKWSNLTTSANAVQPQAMETDNGVYSRFRLARFGNDEVAIVVNRVDGPVYAFRIPDGDAVASPVSVNLTASPRNLTSGDSTTLNWSAVNATSCTTSGGWSGSRPTSGTETITNIQTPTSYTIDCSNTTGSNGRATVQIAVASGSATTNTPPTISGSPATTVGAGESYSFVPTAGDPNGDRLAFTISGRPAWAQFDTGSGALTGTPTAINAGVTSNITISVSDGFSTKSLAPFSITVSAQATLGGTLSWDPPTTRSDGQPLVDLAGFTIYYGPASRSYTQSIRVGNPGLTSYYIDGLIPGTYYFAVASFDSVANESVPSEEVRATLRSPNAVDPGTPSPSPTPPPSSSGNAGSSGNGAGGTDSPDGGAGSTNGVSAMTPVEVLVYLALLLLTMLRQFTSVGASKMTGKHISAALGTLTLITSLSAQADDRDFQSRCAAPGVLKCVGFDAGSSIPQNTKLFKSGDGRFLGTIDNTQYASGGGSLRFEIPSNSGPNSSGFWLDDLGAAFGEGSHFYVQWRQRFSQAMLNTRYENGDGWKQIILHRDGPSCANVQVVIQNVYQRNVPVGYSHCGSPSEYHFAKDLPDGDTQLQQGDYNCLRRSLKPSDCASYVADAWMTFYLDIQVGTFGENNSHVQASIGYPGQPMKKFIDMPDYRFAFDDGHGDTFRKIQLTPYNTNKSSAQSHPSAYTWYDELIVSSKPIAGPVGSPSAAPPPSTVAAPAAPSNLAFQQ